MIGSSQNIWHVPPSMLLGFELNGRRDEMAYFLRQPSYMPSVDRRLSALSPARALPQRLLQTLETNHTKEHRRATEREVEKWETWCAAYDRPALPIDDVYQLSYLYERLLFGDSLRVLRGSYSALNTYQFSNGLRRENNGLITSFFRAISKNATIIRATPCTPEDIAAMCALARLHGGLRGLRDVAILLYFWHSAERSSEVLRTAARDMAPRRHGALVHIPRSKTDQAGRGQYITIQRQYDVDMCAIHALERWVAAAGITEGPVFYSITRSGCLRRSLTSSGLYYIVKQYLVALGIPGKATTYSFRRGWATNAFLENRPLDEIKEHLRHFHRKTTKAYIDPLPGVRPSANPYARMVS